MANLDEHIQTMKAQNINVEKTQLMIGDALWVARTKAGPTVDYVLDFIVERKRLDDLTMSIKDGRYRKQKFFMTQAGVSNLIYLSEGQIIKADNFKMLNSAMIQTQVFDGFLTIEIEKAKEIFSMYVYLTEAITRRYSSMSYSPRAAVPQTFPEFQRRVKLAMDSDKTVNHVWGLMLMEADKVGHVAAKGTLSRDAIPPASLSASSF